MCGLSLVAVSGGFSLAVVHGLLIEVASLVTEHGASIFVAQSLSCFMTCGIFLDQESIEPVPLALKCEFLTTGPPGKSEAFFFFFIHSSSSDKLRIFFSFLSLHFTFIFLNFVVVGG